MMTKDPRKATCVEEGSETEMLNKYSSMTFDLKTNIVHSYQEFLSGHGEGHGLCSLYFIFILS